MNNRLGQTILEMVRAYLRSSEVQHDHHGIMS